VIVPDSFMGRSAPRLRFFELVRWHSIPGIVESVFVCYTSRPSSSFRVHITQGDHLSLRVCPASTHLDLALIRRAETHLRRDALSSRLGSHLLSVQKDYRVLAGPLARIDPSTRLVVYNFLQ
jgi:hypothetical protein